MESVPPPDLPPPPYTSTVTLVVPVGWADPGSDACPPEVRRLLVAADPRDGAEALALGARLLDAWRSASASGHERHRRRVAELGQDLGAQQRRAEGLAEQVRASEASAAALRQAQAAMQAEFAAALEGVRRRCAAEVEEQQRLARAGGERDREAAERAGQQLLAVVESCHGLVEAARADERERAAAEVRECREQLRAREVRGANPSVRGRANEAAFRDLVVRALGAQPGFRVLDLDGVDGDGAPRPESGDLRVQVGEDPAVITLMFENKKYAGAVPRAEVEKAHRDFRLHPECAALFFVSEDSRITGHDRAHDVDMALVDGRPAFYLSHFARCDDPAAALLMLLAVVRLWRARGEGREAPTMAPVPGPGELTEALAGLRARFVRSFERVRALRTLWASCKRRMDATMREFAAEIEAAVAHFESSLDGNGGDGEEEGEDDKGKGKGKGKETGVGTKRKRRGGSIDIDRP
jgi:hypothetical protein